MTGRASRDKGNRFERDVAAYLRDTLDVQVRTGRDGRGGAQTASDLQWSDDGRRWLPGVRDWTIELKDVAGTAVPSWLEQARIAAHLDDCTWWAVVHKQRRRPVDDARVFVPRLMLRDFLEHGEPDPDGYGVRDHVTMSLGAFREVAL